jgi:hypothetical protein
MRNYPEIVDTLVGMIDPLSSRSKSCDSVDWSALIHSRGWHECEQLHYSIDPMIMLQDALSENCEHDM